MSEYVFGIDGYITADVNADEWLDAFLEWMEGSGWQFGGVTGESELAALKRVRDAAQLAYEYRYANDEARKVYLHELWDALLTEQESGR